MTIKHQSLIRDSNSLQSERLTIENIEHNVSLGDKLVVTGSIVGSGHLILSSAVGSIVAVSSSMNFQNKDKSYHIKSSNSDLIIGASTNYVTFSGTILGKVAEPYGWTGQFINAISVSPSIPTSFPSMEFHVNRVGICSNATLAFNSNTILNGGYPLTVYLHKKTANNGTVGSGTLAISGTNGLNSTITSDSGDLILSSSITSIVAISSSMIFSNIDKAYHIRAVNSHLILSSSAGGTAVSGNLAIAGVSAGTGRITFTDINGTPGMAYASPFRFHDSGNTLFALQNTGPSADSRYGWTLFDDNNNIAARARILVPTGNTTGSIQFFSSSDGFRRELILQARGIFSNSGSLVLSGGLDSVVAVSSSLVFPNLDKFYHINAVNGHLILSSSVGSTITISGALSVLNNNAIPALLITGSSGGQHLDIASPELAQASIRFRVGATTKWQLGKLAGQEFFIYNNSTGSNGSPANDFVIYPDHKMVFAITASVGRYPTGNAFEVQGTAGKTDGSTAWATISDERLKKNINTLNSGSLNKLTSLRPVSFMWNYDNETAPTKAGFIAQELSGVFPEWVKSDISGNLWFHPQGFESHLVNAIQELKARIEFLELEIKNK